MTRDEARARVIAALDAGATYMEDVGLLTDLVFNAAGAARAAALEEAAWVCDAAGSHVVPFRYVNGQVFAAGLADAIRALAAKGGEGG